MVKVLERKYINLLLGFGIIFMIVLIYLAFSQINKLNNANKWIIHSHYVIEETDIILIDINYIESMMRAYFITGDKEKIAKLDNVSILLQKSILKLKNLTRDNAYQQIYINKLLDDIVWRNNDIHERISIYNAGGIKKLLTLPNTGSVVSDRIRDTISKIIAYESTLLNNRGKIAQDEFVLINNLIFISGFFSLAFLFIGVILLNQQINYRTKAEHSLKKFENELYNLAYYDSLTGLANRTMIHNSINNIINNNENPYFGLLFIDLDNFKNINDSLGHEVGDGLLKSYAKRLIHALENKNIIARLGGDEFIVLLPNINNQEDAWNIANNILYLMSQPFHIKTHKIFITSSIGISMYPANGISSNELLKNADIAMYKAKELGKNNIQLCVPALTRHAEEHALIDYDLHHALTNNEFYLVYQPIISLKDDSVVSVEVLIRWQRPNVGVVYPGKFIKLAENNGLIMPIGDWTLRMACIESKKWMSRQRPGMPIKLAVNVSTRQFTLSDFVYSVTNILNETHFDPSLLELEITEGVLFENSQSNLATLNALKEMGIKISIDDFGTGYSSLNYLRTFAVDKLKIDRSFVSETIPDNYTSRIIKSIINMAHDLNITVLAEGVETQKQMEFLRKHHCDEVQGFYYSHPLTGNEFSAFLEQHGNINL